MDSRNPALDEELQIRKGLLEGIRSFNMWSLESGGKYNTDNLREYRELRGVFYNKFRQSVGKGFGINSRITAENITLRLDENNILKGVSFHSTNSRKCNAEFISMLNRMTCNIHFSLHPDPVYEEIYNIVNSITNYNYEPAERKSEPEPAGQQQGS